MLVSEDVDSQDVVSKDVVSHDVVPQDVVPWECGFKRHNLIGCGLTGLWLVYTYTSWDHRL